MSGEEAAPAVLIVDDDEEVVETNRLRLDDKFDVDVATGGEEALEVVDDHHDVVLLDRRMPDISGDQVLEEMRARGLDCQVVMVTAVDPDIDIIGMQVTDYVVKPVSKQELIDVVERALALAEYSDQRRRLGRKKLKRNVLEVELHENELAESEEYQTLQEDIERLEASVAKLEDDLGLEEVDKFL